MTCCFVWTLFTAYGACVQESSIKIGGGTNFYFDQVSSSPNIKSALFHCLKKKCIGK